MTADVADGRIAFTAHYRVRAGSVTEVLAALRAMAESVRAHEPDCLVYHVNLDPDDAEVLVLYEVYTDDDAYRRHRETDHFQRYVVDLVRPLLTDRVVTRYRQVVW